MTSATAYGAGRHASGGGVIIAESVQANSVVSGGTADAISRALASKMPIMCAGSRQGATKALFAKTTWVSSHSSS
jgi:predicted secreted Zn-dependent protease